MKEHIGVQHKPRYGVAVLANNILTELLQYATNLREVIAVGVEFGFRVLRRRLRNQATHKECKEYRAHSLFIHMPFSFQILPWRLDRWGLPIPCTQHFTEEIGALTWTRAEPRRCCARTRSTAPDARVDLRESASARPASSCLVRTVSPAPAGRCRKVPQSLFA